MLCGKGRWGVTPGQVPTDAGPGWRSFLRQKLEQSWRTNSVAVDDNPKHIANAQEPILLKTHNWVDEQIKERKQVPFLPEEKQKPKNPS